jgi:glycosyltransferase involved in cell wall biosynthesis
MTPYVGTIRRYCKTPIVLRSHNLEFVIWEKIARGTKNILKKTYLNYLTKKLRHYELSMLDEVSGIAAISEEDKKRILALGVNKKIKTIPFGIDLEKYPSDESTHPELALFHLGAMDWGPNLEGILWFLNSIWPSIHEKYPQLKMYLAGRNMSEEIRDINLPNVEMIGEVDDAISFMCSKAIMVVPLLSAGGIRVKIIEGLALGKVVISTTLGAEGLDCTDRKNIMLADRPDEWIQALDELLSDPQLLYNLRHEGRKHASIHFDNNQITNQLVNFYKELRKG